MVATSGSLLPVLFSALKAHMNEADDGDIRADVLDVFLCCPVQQVRLAVVCDSSEGRGCCGIA